MTRKDYVLIAAAIAEVASYSRGHAFFARSVAENLADSFQADNPSFDRERFLQACLPSHEGRTQ